ncbi:unnamed protein product [Schistosoma mattheei]|uniref:Uncharacterized protein n=1 Tax=Schistosoma mattheei TaxID=31246 RepID=A0A3P8EJ52_9TREM|nr:unnamed protein product [Schistosoma mattheei]
MVAAPDIRFSSTQFLNQHPSHEKVVSRTCLLVVVCTWLLESISRGRAESLHSLSYQGHLGAIPNCALIY